MSDGGEIVLQVFGDNCSLGNLYVGATGQILPGGDTLFTSDSIDGATVITAMPKTEVQFKQVRSSKDRAHLLNVSASLSANVMSGMISFKGFGQYLDRSEENEECTTISGAVTTRTVQERLDLSNAKLLSSVALTNDRLRQDGVTHVVTAITKGGVLLGSLMEKKWNRDSQQKLEGSFDLSIMAKLGSLAGVEGKARAEKLDSLELRGYELEVGFGCSDTSRDFELPTRNSESIINAITRGFPNYTSDPAQKDKHGYPIEITLTPITRFDSISTELLFQELADADLHAIMDFYDDLMLLMQRRNALRNILSSPSLSITNPVVTYDRIFETFSKACAQREEDVKSLFAIAQNDMASFLRTYRTQSDPSATVEGFMDPLHDQYELQMNLLEQDRAMWEGLYQTDVAALTSGFPLVLGDVGISLTRSDDDLTSIVLVLVIPPAVRRLDLINAYRVWGSELRALQSQIDSNASFKSKYHTYYSDPEHDDKFLALEDSGNGAIQFALSTAQESGKPAFVKCAPITKFRSVWSTLGQSDSGMIIDETNRTRYVGDLKNGMPHGHGVMSYVDGSKYMGSFIQGRRDGIGRIVKGSEVMEDGPFFDNLPSYETRFLELSEKDTARRFEHDVVTVKVYNWDETMVTSATFALTRHHPPEPQVRKIGFIFGWQDGARYKLTPMYRDPDSGLEMSLPYSVVTNGWNLDPSSGQAPEVNDEPMWWPNGQIQQNGVWKHILTYDGYTDPSLDVNIRTPFEPLVVKAIPV